MNSCDCRQIGIKRSKRVKWQYRASAIKKDTNGFWCTFVEEMQL